MASKSDPKFINEEISEWSFPEVDELNTDVQDDMFIEEIHSNEDSDFSEEIQQEYVPEMEPEIVVGKTEADKIHDELFLLKVDYEKKIESVNRILEKLQNPLANIDNDMVLLIQDIIKKVAHRIIQKEITLDAANIKAIIGDLHQLIQSKNGLTNVFVSQADFDRIDAAGPHLKLMVQVDNTLTDGDVIIKSNTSEVRGILSERIDLLMKVENE
ncbi:MAG: FliH/SctL family protein [Gammaproteobacteria bacterium]|nr:FliH/SctL family protein [Gammaproteobacteria bacterium]